MSNAQLQDVYNRVYRDGAEAFYTIDSWQESREIFATCGNVRGKTVLEIGCGLGRLSAHIALGGAKVVHGWDYSEQAITQAREAYNLHNLRFHCGDFHTATDTYDVIVLQGVLEHFDDPFIELLYLLADRLNSGGHVVTSSPCFVNMRGYIWQALRVLLDVPMSLTDLHVIDPWAVEQFCRDNHYRLGFRTIHGTWAAGEILLTDFRKRLPNALRDAKFPVDKVPEFLQWLERACDEPQGIWLPDSHPHYVYGVSDLSRRPDRQVVVPRVSESLTVRHDAI